MRVAVIGAGAFGGWTALRLQELGAQVTLVEAWGPGHARASSGGETRIIRAMYGGDEASTALAQRALELWKQRQAQWGVELLIPSGMLLLGEDGDEFVRASRRLLGEACEEMSAAEAQRRFPQIRFAGVGTVLFERDAGVLKARENCRVVVERFVAAGGVFRLGVVAEQRLGAAVDAMVLRDGSRLEADAFVFACGPWLPQVVPDVLGELIEPTRQEVLFFAPPAGEGRFDPECLPCWGDRTSESKFYGLPDVHGRGFKIASDLRGERFDPDYGDRIVRRETVERAREYLRVRFPTLGDSVLTESRVCRYENTPDLGLLVDRHPRAENVWLVGGGSGHGYKHGPAIGEYVAELVCRQRIVDARLGLARFTGGVRSKMSSF